VTTYICGSSSSVSSSKLDVTIGPAAVPCRESAQTRRSHAPASAADRTESGRGRHAGNPRLCIPRTCWTGSRPCSLDCGAMAVDAPDGDRAVGEHGGWATYRRRSLARSPAFLTFDLPDRSCLGFEFVVASRAAAASFAFPLYLAPRCVPCCGLRPCRWSP